MKTVRYPEFSCDQCGLKTRSEWIIPVGWCGVRAISGPHDKEFCSPECLRDWTLLLEERDEKSRLKDPWGNKL